MPKPERKITLTDIADHSGVSIATVSLVLRDKPGVGEDKRQRVLESARALGYVYTPSIQAHARTIPDQIGLLIKSLPDDVPATNSFYAPVLSGIETICRRHQISLMVGNLLVDSLNNPLETPRMLADQKVDGLLIVGMHLGDSAAEEIADHGIPIVLVDAYADGDPFDAVITDNEFGAYLATSTLIEQGHRRIGIAGSLPASYPSIQERRNGYLRAIEANNLSPYFADGPLHPIHSEPAIYALLVNHPEVTAVFACNDDVAIAVIRTAQQLGRRVPDDLSVIGFDDIEMSRHVTPRLTTMRVDQLGMGRQAAQLLLNRLEFPESGRVRTMICPHLVERDSVQALSENRR